MPTSCDPTEALAAGLVPKRGTAPMVRGDGCWLWDRDDRRYLDLTSAHGVAPLGHSHPAVAGAIAEQAQRLISCSASFYNDRRAELLGALREILPAHFEHLFLCSTGTEAIEAALKFAYLATRRAGVVALKRGFHGRTLGALATTWNPRFRRPFEALLNPVRFVAPESAAELDEALDDDVGVFVAEIVQGESGVHPLDEDYLRTAARLCRERGVLLLVDEIQTGVGRTGAWWAHESAGIEPDLMTIAKGVGGGFPLGAVASTAGVAAALEPGLHGSTFGGSPLACAAGSATLGEMKRLDLPAEARRKGEIVLERLRARLDGAALVKEIRGRGLMVGIELRRRVGPYLRTLLEEHAVIALPAGPTVLRLLPALVVTEEQLDAGVEALGAVLTAT